MGSSQSLPANYWFLCGLGKKLEGKRAFQEWLPQHGSGCTHCERLTLTFRHDVWISKQSAFEDNALFVPISRDLVCTMEQCPSV